MTKYCPQCGRIIFDRSMPACPRCNARLPWAAADQPPAPPEPAEPALPAEPAQPADTGWPGQAPALPRPVRAPVRPRQELPPGPEEYPEHTGPVLPSPPVPPARQKKSRSRHPGKPVPEVTEQAGKWIGICCGGMILLIIVSAFFAAMSEDSSWDDEEDVTVPPTYDIPETPDARTEITAAIGMPISGDAVQATVWSARRTQSYNWSTGNYNFTEEAENGTTWLIVDAEVKNTGQDTLYASTGDFSLLDGTGNRYEPGLYLGDESFGYLHELSRNEKNRGKILFEVPPEARDLKISYDFGIPYGGTRVGSWPVE